MKNLLLAAFAVVLIVPVYAQTDWGLRGGLNLANQRVVVEAFDMKVGRSGKIIPSIHAGAFVDFPVSHNISIRPEISLSGKGTNFTEIDDMDETYTVKVRAYYIELPVSILYTREIRNSLRIFGGVGPTLSYGIAGKAKGDGESEDLFVEDGFKRFDFGFHLTGGVELPSRLFFNINYTHGLANIISDVDADVDVTWKNRVIGVSVGYFLKRR